ncbi:ATP-binding protein [Pontibacter arcticus]|uniref:histidine kinase n=1 Tax=Pontibacter arcticus TaxID=2080288 RepID=A0A364REZ3_9BACT|nr:tetratricopeptide repeat-containing sensor histidine kinase [Pontibacter arcticus]RAU82837.1 hypothetical protein DP923_06180 [Pontibacter arcticus]
MRLLLISLLLITGIATAQPAKTDSLIQKLRLATSDTTRIRLHNALATAYFGQDAMRGIKHATQALAMATKAKNHLGKAKALLLLSRGNLILGQYDRGLNRAFSALKIGTQLQDTTIMFGAQNMLGIMYFKLDDTTNAQLHYTTALELATKTTNKSWLGKTYNNLGNLYEIEGNYRKALRYFQKAVMLQAALGDVQSQAINLHNIGNIHLNLAEPAQGLPYLYQSIQLNRSIGNQMLLPTTLGSIANIYLATGDTLKALATAKQSYDASLATNSSKKISAAAQLLQQIYASMRQFEPAYQLMVIIAKHEARLDLESQQKAAAEITARYEAEGREEALQRLEAEKEKQGLMIAQQQLILVLGGVIIILLLISFLILYISRKKIRKTHTDLVEVNSKLLQQHVLISTQKDDLATQALLLQQQNEALEKHSTFKNKIFSIISHDLRAPLNSLKGILSLANSPSLTEERIKVIFGLLEKEMVTAANMLQNLLIWAKAQLEASTLALEELNIAKLAATVISETEAQASIKNIKIQLIINPDFSVTADKERLSFVLRNLVTNAIKFTQPDGEIRLEANLLDTAVAIHVIDAGEGIAAENVSNLFTEKRFSTLGTQQEKGTGLGLVFSYELLQSMNGKMKVDSQPGKGSTFTILLPKIQNAVNEISGEDKVKTLAL